MRNFDLAPLYRATVGYDQLADMMDRVLSADVAQPTYPPYNIEKLDQDSYRITIAVAGFSDEELAIRNPAIGARVATAPVKTGHG